MSTDPEEKQGAGREEGHVENMNKHSWASESQERPSCHDPTGLLPEPSPVLRSARASQVGAGLGWHPQTQMPGHNKRVPSSSL